MIIIIGGGRCAAVLFIDGNCLYTDGIPNESIMEKFQEREDRLINYSEVCFT